MDTKDNTMINRILILFVFSLLYSCRNYESEKYVTKENEAINDIIRQLIKYDVMVEINNLDTNQLKIFLISSLHTETFDIQEPQGFIVGVNGVGLSESEIEENRKIYEEKYKQFKKEQKLFTPLKNGVLKERKIDYKFEYSNLQVEFIERPDKFEELKQNEYGFLYISRIAFNRCFDKGYLTYSFFCGEGCYWSENIEIVKINGKWKISETFSGGIA